ncbi:MAG: ATP-binding cassette domain-containing protein [Paracoccaceae bacterium]
MIVLSDVCKSRRLQGAPGMVLDHVDAVFGAGERVGILAQTGVEKSILARLLCGVERPDSGAIDHRCKTSWPLGNTDAFAPELSVAQNVAMIAQLSGAAPQEMLAFVAGWPGLGGALSQKFGAFAPPQRAQIGLACSLAPRCDIYIADEMIGALAGPQSDAVEARISARLQGAGLILVSHNPRQIQHWCNRFFVFVSSKLFSVSDVGLAVEILRLGRLSGADQSKEAALETF